MRSVLVVVLVLVALLVLDQLALWAERKGWIFYRKRKSSPGSVASAALAAHSLLEPRTKALAEATEASPAEQDPGAGPPEPAARLGRRG